MMPSSGSFPGINTKSAWRRRIESGKGGKVVVQDIESYEQAQETIALLKILALGMRQIEAGEVVSAEEAIQRVPPSLRKSK